MAATQLPLHAPTRRSKVNRYPYHLSLRTDDPFERSLVQAMKLLPHGASKEFWVTLARMFLGNETDVETLRNTMYALSKDRRPMRVLLTPDLDMPTELTRIPASNGALAHLQVETSETSETSAVPKKGVAAAPAAEVVEPEVEPESEPEPDEDGATPPLALSLSQQPLFGNLMSSSVFLQRPY